MQEHEEAPVRLSGVVEEIIFRNEENGYTVFAVGDGDEYITVTGTGLFLAEGVEISAVGAYVTHPQYGRQFRADVIEQELPATAAAVLKYLASGAVRGVGPVTAERIVRHFGDDTLRVMEETPERLAVIRGISESKARHIGNVVRLQFSARRTLLALQEMGLTPAFAVRAFMLLGAGAAEAVRQDPYLLCEPPLELPFFQADELAGRLGLEPDGERRLCAGLKYVLRHNAQNGHTWLPRAFLIEKTAGLLETDPGVTAAALLPLLEREELAAAQVAGREAVFLRDYFEAERLAAVKLQSLAGRAEPAGAHPERELAALEARQRITYEPRQREAILLGLTRRALVVTGGPGTGKTTILQAVLRLLDGAGVKTVLAAPTGRAAKRLSDITGHPAKTVHRLLEVEYRGGMPVFLRNEQNPLQAGAVIVDEMSMVDSLLFASLLRAVPPDARLILTGDADQLPSVGAGNVLRDIIASGVVETVHLTEIFRQAADSRIVLAAHQINRGEAPALRENTGDLYFIERAGETEIARTVQLLVTERIPEAFGVPTDDIQVISPQKRGPAGTLLLNARLQAALNPPARGKGEKRLRGLVFREGDRVMQVKNNYDIEWRSEDTGERGKGVWNGDIGLIEEIDEEDGTCGIRFDDRVCRMEFGQLGDVEPAWAVTVHKSQGSEFPAVVIPVFSAAGPLLNRNLIYTALTRARDLCVLVGSREAFAAMVHNDKRMRRFSALRWFLQEGEDA